MNKKFQLHDISKYRTELMGLSALLILLCHSTAYIAMPGALRYSLAFGNIGVDLFLLLSGIGMWYSLSKPTTEGGVKHWYSSRYLKLFVPYLACMLPFQAIEFSLGMNHDANIWDYLFGLSTLRFYVSHNAPWFIAALIPLYLLAPVFYRLINKYRLKATLSLIIALYATLLIPQSFGYEMLNYVISNTQFVTVRATCFVLGMGLGQAIKNKTLISVWWLITMTITGLAAVAATRHLVYGYFFLSLPLITIFCHWLKNGRQWVRHCAGFLGKISLESYLLNAFLPKMSIAAFAALGLQSVGKVAPYITACILGCAIGYGLHLFSSKLLTSIIFKNNSQNQK